MSVRMKLCDTHQLIAKGVKEVEVDECIKLSSSAAAKSQNQPCSKR